MEFSPGELTVMEELWKGECLDENGEIQALDLKNMAWQRQVVIPVLQDFLKKKQSQEDIQNTH